MRKLCRFLYAALVLIILAIIFGFFIDVKTVMIMLFSLLLLTGYVMYKEKIGQELIVAFLFAVFITSYYVYEYTTQNLIIGRINLFPLVAWTFGLVLLREMYERAKWNYKFVEISIMYIIILFLIEYIGFYVLNIRLKTNFPDLFGLGIIHAPIGMKFFYVLAGPVYLLITDYLKVK
jgi:hypothetical protein